MAGLQEWDGFTSKPTKETTRTDLVIFEVFGTEVELQLAVNMLGSQRCAVKQKLITPYGDNVTNSLYLYRRYIYES